MPGRILVTGGAGYIGSHTVLQLVEAGNSVVVVDNLYSGHEWAVARQATFYQGDIHDRKLIRNILKQHEIEAVMHFAAHTVVSESVQNPSKYYHNNVLGSLNLIEACIEQGVAQFIFSSSAAVYGATGKRTVNESDRTSPINPYGTTKLITEWMLHDFAESTGGDFNYIALRYFNVAGANMGGKLGQATPEATHLIKVACQTACGIRPGISIFGDDYDTPDGTCIRDYIHVDDLAAAHLDAWRYLQDGGKTRILNCGYGNGFSVREVIECVKSVSNTDFEVDVRQRRPGDPPQLVADSDKIRRLLNWQPQYNDLEIICRSAYEWEMGQGSAPAADDYTT